MKQNSQAISLLPITLQITEQSQSTETAFLLDEMEQDDVHQAKTPNGYAIVGLPWLDAKCPPKPLHYSPPQLDKEENITKRLVGCDEERERSLSSYCHGQKQTHLGGKINLIYYQSKKNRTMRNKTKS